MGLQPIRAQEGVTGAEGDVTPEVQCPCVQSGESREQGTEELKKTICVQNIVNILLLWLSLILKSFSVCFNHVLFH